MTIGERIRNRRKELGLTVDQLAEKLGKNRATVYRYESDAIKDLPLTVLEPLADALNISPTDLLFDPPTEEEMRKMSKEFREETLYNFVSNYGEEYEDVILGFESLNKDNRKKVLDYINKLKTLQDLESENDLLIAAHANNGATTEQLQSDVNMLKQYLKKGDEG